MMNIVTKVAIIPIRIKLKEPFIISRGTITHAENVVVKIHCDSGLYGIGECSSFAILTGQTQENIVAVGKELAPLLIGKKATEIKKIMRLVDQFIMGNQSIKSAIDIALYDLNAKLVQLPLYAYLGGSPDKKMHTNMTIGLGAKETMAAKARQYVDAGFPVLKVKLGDPNHQKDVERIRAIREEIGPEHPIRIDANQGWNYQQAIQVLRALAPLNIQHCEAPLPAPDLLGRIKLRQESPIPIMGDESVFSHQDAYRNLAANAIDLINIKLGKSGGIDNAMKIAAIAEAAGAHCQVGGFMESRLATSALVHFALAWDCIVHFDLDVALLQAENPVTGDMTFHKDWQVTVSDAPGHGADFDPDFLNQFRQTIINSQS